MKRAALLLLVVAGCDDWGDLAEQARRRANDAGSGGGGVATGGGLGGGAAGGGAGGGVAGGAAGGSADVDGGSAIVGVWKRGGASAAAVVPAAGSVVVFVNTVPNHDRYRISPTGEELESRGGLQPVVGAYARDGRMVMCTGLPQFESGSVAWLNPMSLVADPAVALNFLPQACNLYPTEDGGTNVAVWGTRDAGTLLAVAYGPDPTAVAQGVSGGCDGGIVVHRIRYSPYDGAGILTGAYHGECSVDGRRLNWVPQAAASGFVARVADPLGVAHVGFSSTHRVVSEQFGGDHFIAFRDNAAVLLAPLSRSSNNFAGNAEQVTMNAALLREAFELVASPSELLLVGGQRPGFLSDRDITVHQFVPGGGFRDPAGFVIESAGDQEVTSATWVPDAGVLAIAGFCRPSMDGGQAPESMLCTGDGGSFPTSFVVFLDPTKF